MQPTLVFTTGIDPFQLLINLGTCSIAGHAAIGLGDQLLHAHESGVLLEPRSSWFGRDEQSLVAEFVILPDVSEGIDFAMTQLGKKYDAGGVLRIAISRLLRLTLSPITYFGPAPMKRHMCSAFVMLVDPYGAQIPEWRDLDRAIVTPSDLLGAASLGSSFRRIA